MYFQAIHAQAKQVVYLYTYTDVYHIRLTLTREECNERKREGRQMRWGSDRKEVVGGRTRSWRTEQRAAEEEAHTLNSGRTSITFLLI